MQLMTQEAAMMLYESSEQFRPTSHEKGQLSGIKDILAIWR
ncbi:hypothetical protein DET48_12924 [Vibrio diazotrophicus]|uniref:Uncharacterized protein n=1 Tax=Vibrio diazotrophicus TaxID=685 RepID=A0A329E4D9_VIBDI|nr:hypothetical protein DET48_12924 [Vibrio diazotrophicus]